MTDLHNLATPMIRYEIGDIAEWGEPCACGRGLPVLRRIVGRTLSLLRLPDGDTLIPDIERQDLHLIAPIREAQVIQRGFDRDGSAAGRDRPLTDDELARVGRAISHGLHDRAFDLQFRVHGPYPALPGRQVRGIPLRDSLSLLTFNLGLAHFPPFLRTPRAAERLARAPEALRGTGADIIALQEVFPAGHRRFIARALARHPSACAGARVRFGRCWAVD